MSAATSPIRYRLTVEDYRKMEEAGIFAPDDRIELIEGELLRIAPVDAQHAHVMARLTKLLAAAVGDQGVVSIRNPVALPPCSQVWPDLAILKPGGEAAGPPLGSEALLLIEVGDALTYCRETKLPLYAQHGVPEVWVVDVAAKRVEVYREPGPKRYQRKLELGAADKVSPAALPKIKLRLQAVFGHTRVAPPAPMYARSV